jgi:hypothetical protein
MKARLMAGARASGRLGMKAIGRTCVFLAAVAWPATTGAAEDPPYGCYARVYAPDHLAAHRGQIVSRVSLVVKPADASAGGRVKEPVADGNLSIWIRGRKERFDSLGACWRNKDGFSCGGSLSAAEADVCKTTSTGARNCRVDPGDAGGFDILSRPNGVAVRIRNRLELVPKPYDGAPFLNLAGQDAENHDFLLEPAASDMCR